jgi:nucleotide-binding universal stress UspA family protein
MTQTILHPTDYSETSAAALRVACSLARDRGGRLIVLHVAPRTSTNGAAGEREAAEELPRQLQTWCQGVGAELLLEQGEVSARILRVAREVRCDIIVMATRGRSWLKRVLRGSVTDSVMREAGCPLVLVKLPPDQTRPQEQDAGGTPPAH